MGCDIHLHSEIRINGVWHHYDIAHIRRNYDLFVLMAGVRAYSSDIETISQPRGLPDDVTFVTKFDSDVVWGPDGHSHSWLSSEEVPKLFKFVKEQGTHRNSGLFWEHDETGYLFGNGYAEFKEYPNDYPKELEDYRWVFWFDN